MSRALQLLVITFVMLCGLLSGHASQTAPLERGAAIICFPEGYVPGYRIPSRDVAPADRSFLESACLV